MFWHSDSFSMSFDNWTNSIELRQSVYIYNLLCLKFILEWHFSLPELNGQMGIYFHLMYVVCLSVQLKTYHIFNVSRIAVKWLKYCRRGANINKSIYRISKWVSTKRGTKHFCVKCFQIWLNKGTISLQWKIEAN